MEFSGTIYEYNLDVRRAVCLTRSRRQSEVLTSWSAMGPNVWFGYLRGAMAYPKSIFRLFSLSKPETDGADKLPMFSEYFVLVLILVLDRFTRTLS